MDMAFKAQWQGVEGLALILSETPVNFRLD
jgi:hypothetical protein